MGFGMKGPAESYDAMLEELEREGGPGFTMEPAPLPDEKAIEWFGKRGDEIARRLELSCMQVTWPSGKVAYCLKEEDYTRAKAASLALKLTDSPQDMPRTPDQRRKHIHEAIMRTVEKHPDVALAKLLGADSISRAENTLCDLVEGILSTLPEETAIINWPDQWPSPEQIEAMPDVRIAMTAFLIRPSSETVIEAISTIAIALTKPQENNELIH